MSEKVISVFRVRANGAGFMVPIIQGARFTANRVYVLSLEGTNHFLEDGKRLRGSTVEKLGSLIKED